ncbi:MAG: NAD(P) transhydrogenase subunit alpha [Longimicrobiales bacterium]|nr:NAD(P) transhydrogenase subunit alpha [Longimicrobiales bacterium]
MNDLLLAGAVFAFSFVVGYLLISKVPPMLHTPLMSMTNAISAITVLGALLVFAVVLDTSQKLIGALAIALAIFNVVGGFAITDRMLGMFKEKPEKG